MKVVARLVGACALAACNVPPSAPTTSPRPSTSTTSAAASSAPSTASAPASAVPTAAPGALPPSDRVFFGGGLVLGADGTRLWARSPGPNGVERFRVDGPGVVHQVEFGDAGDGPAFYVARGVGRGHLDAPLVLQRIDPETGATTELWRHQGERNEPAHLGLEDVNGDGRPDVAFAYYASKYMVRTRHLLAGGAVVEGPEVRMATSRVFADVDADGRVDEVVGRVYGDAKDVPGDLRVFLAKGKAPVPVPTENGVKALYFGSTGASKTNGLYFCDGWVANYGQAAKARVRRVRFDAKGPRPVETLAESADEFTFFSFHAADVNGDGTLELIAQGDKRVTVFVDRGGPKLEPSTQVPLEPVLNVAVGVDAGGRPTLYVPARTGTTAHPLGAAP
jgi:hypothetical protein